MKGVKKTCNKGERGRLLALSMYYLVDPEVRVVVGVDQELHLRVDLVLAVPDERQRLVHLLQYHTGWRGGEGDRVWGQYAACKGRRESWQPSRKGPGKKRRRARCSTLQHALLAW